MKLCVLGNSHVASLKSAWDEISSQAEFSDVSVTYFANTRQSMKALRVQDGKLVPRTERLKEGIRYTSNGLTEIVPEDYDVFLVYGGRFRVHVVDVQSFSDAVIESWITDSIESSSSIDNCRKLREITDKPIFVGHDPLMALKREELVANETTRYEDVVGLNQKHVFDSLECTVLSQPENTIYKGQFTKQEYSSGSTSLTISDDRLDELHSHTDVWHMNSVFGQLYWAKNMPAIKEQAKAA